MTAQLYVGEPERAEIREPVDLDTYVDEPLEPEIPTDPLEQMFESWVRLVAAPFAAVVPFNVTVPLGMMRRLSRVDEIL